MYRLLFFVLISVSSQAQTIKPNHELLWEITGNGLENPSYLFGSLHMNDKRLFNLSDSTYVALNRSETIVLETDVFSLFENFDTRKGEVKMKYDNEGIPYITHASPSQTIYGDEDGMPQFLDAYFQQYCYNAGKAFQALESTDFQQNLFSDFKPNTRGLRVESMFTSNEALTDLYLEGDIYSIDEYLRVSLSMYANGYDKLITERNISMSGTLDSLLNEKKAPLFCAIGAGHLAGREGVINLLRQKGYVLRKIQASYSDVLRFDKVAVESKKFYHYMNDSIGLNVVFPGRPTEVTNGDSEVALKLIYRDLGQGNTYSVEAYPILEEIGLPELAQMHIASPVESPSYKVLLDNGGEAYEGLADAYPEGLYWVRVLLTEDYFVVLKSYGGNKFMSSKRAHHFFDNCWFE